MSVRLLLRSSLARVVAVPVNGYVINLTVDVGQFATVGARVLALIDSDSYRLTAYFEETKIPSVPPGKQVEIFLMSGGAPLRGHVVSISCSITDRDNPSGPDLLANATPTFLGSAGTANPGPHSDRPRTGGILISSGMRGGGLAFLHFALGRFGLTRIYHR